MIHDIYTAFGNKIRTKLVVCLAAKAKNVTELISTCGLSQSAVSQHLKKLRSGGVVTTEKRGKEVYYRLRHQKAADIGKLLMSFEKEII